MTKLDRKQLASGEGAISLSTNVKTKRIDLRRWQSPLDVADAAQRAAVEAVLETMESCHDPEAALGAGKAAFLAAMPRLTSRVNIRAYVACLDVGSRGDWIDGAELVSMVRLVTAAIQGYARDVKGREQ